MRADLALRVIMAALSIAMLLSAPNVLANKVVDRLEELLDINKPEGVGPFPAVVMVSGFSGFKWPFCNRAQAELLEEGF